MFGYTIECWGEASESGMFQWRCSNVFVNELPRLLMAPSAEAALTQYRDILIEAGLI